MRGLISFVIITVTVVFQLTVVSRIAFPGGSGPDLVLVMVAALALASGPLAGALIGFWGGLAMDVAPPGSHFVGQDALVFCLVGYACGLLADDSSGDGATEQGHSALFEIMVVAAGAICGEALVALLGVMLSDPRVTWPAITKVLPVAVAYDVLLCPFVLYAAAALWRLAGRGASRGVWGEGSPQTRGAPGGFRVRPSGLTQNVPRLRLAEAGRGQGSMAGALGARAERRPVGREPHLKLGRAGARTSLGGTGSWPGLRGGLGAAFATSGSGGPAKVRFGSRRHEGVVGGSLLGGTRPASSALKSSTLKSSTLKSSTLKSSALKSSTLRTSRFSSSSMGRSLLGGSVFSHSSSSLGLSQRGSASVRSSPFGRPAALGRSSLFRGGTPFRGASHVRPAGSRMRSPGGLAGSTPRFSRGTALGGLFGFLRRPAQPRSPGRGWLRSGAARRTSLGGGTIGGSGTMRRRAFGRGRPSRGGMGRAGMGRGGMGRGGMGRGWTGARTPGLRSRPARLRMSRPKKPGKPKAYRRWRTGGYR